MLGIGLNGLEVISEILSLTIIRLIGLTRQELWPQFRDYPPHQNIPTPLLQTIWQAIVSPAENSEELREELAEAVSQPPTLVDLQQAIRKAPSGSVPGPSGLSYAMMHEWTEPVLLDGEISSNMLEDEMAMPQTQG